jgi:hypothetical protein
LSAGGGVSVAPAGPGVPVAGGVGEHGEVCAQTFVAGAADRRSGVCRIRSRLGLGRRRRRAPVGQFGDLLDDRHERGDEADDDGAAGVLQKDGAVGVGADGTGDLDCPSSKTPKERRHRRRAARRDRRQPRPLPHRPWAGALWRNALLPLQAPHTAGRRGSHAGRLSGKRGWRSPDGGRLVTLSSLRGQPAFGRTLTQSTSQLGRRTPRRQRLTHERSGSNTTSPQLLTIRNPSESSGNMCSYRA